MVKPLIPLKGGEKNMAKVILFVMAFVSAAMDYQIFFGYGDIKNLICYVISLSMLTLLFFLVQE